MLKGTPEQQLLSEVFITVRVTSKMFTFPFGTFEHSASTL